MIKDKWKLNEIDEMDLAWYFDLVNYTEEKKCIKQSNALDEAGL